MINVFTGFLVLLTSLVSLAAAPKEFRIGISQEFENLNPLIMTMSATTYIYSMAGRTLVTMDPSGKWVPQLAKSIPTLKNGGAVLSSDKSKLTATWEIVEAAKWSDGTPVTCADFAFTRDVAMSPNISIGEREIYSQIDKITWDAKNPKLCTFHHNKARWDFNQLGTFRPLPRHIEEPIFKKYKNQKEGYEKNTAYNRNPTQKGLYNGPFQIVEAKLGSHVTLEANPHFYGKAPQIGRIIVKLIPNTATLDANLRSNTIDMVSTLGFSFDQALNFEKRAKSEKLPFVTQFKPSITYEHIDLNLDNPILKDLNVRRALIHAINRQELVQALFEGKQEVAIHNMAPMDPWFTKDPKVVTLYPFNRRQAMRLLEQSGWKVGSDGVRTKDGKRLSFSLMTTSGNKTREMVQTFLQQQWRAVGVEVVIRNEPARVLFSDTTKKRKFEAMVMFAWVSSPENNPRSSLTCASIPTEKNGWSGQNYVGYCNPELDKIIDQIDVEFDPQKRIALAHQIQKIYTRDAFVIPLYYRSDVAVTPKALKGFELPGHQFAETNFIEDWKIE